MTFYLFITLCSVVGVGVIVFRHRSALFQALPANTDVKPPTFSQFMEDSSTHMRGIWKEHIRAQLLRSLEKMLRKGRILTLRTEHFLFQLTHRVKGIAEQKEEVKMENGSEASTSQEESSSVE